MLDRIKRAHDLRHLPVHVFAAEGHRAKARGMGAVGLPPPPPNRRRSPRSSWD